MTPELNPYSYGLANPITNTDPSGLAACANIAFGLGAAGLLFALFTPESEILAAAFYGISAVAGTGSLVLGFAAITPERLGGGCS